VSLQEFDFQQQLRPAPPGKTPFRTEFLADDSVSPELKGLICHLMAAPSETDVSLKDLLDSRRLGRFVWTRIRDEAIRDAYCAAVDGGYWFTDEPLVISNYSRFLRANVVAKRYITAALRWEIWERDDFRCKRCGARRFLTVDHIHPERHGGTLDPHNLQTLCHPCNSSKGACR
jgi:hypothetical protein